MTKPSPKRSLWRTIITRIVVGLIIMMGLIVIGFEITNFFHQSTEIHEQYSLNQLKQLELLQSELDSEIRHLNQTFPAFVNSQELLNKVNETTLVGPYFVYSPQLYGQPIDYWDRVQILKQQVWLVNYFFPLLQSRQLDYIGVFLLDPHNNLIRNLATPFVELQINQVFFYSYPIKGLFDHLIQHQLSQVQKIALTDNYFNQIIYRTAESDSLYSSLGFEASNQPIPDLPLERFTSSDHINIIHDKEVFILEKAIPLQSPVYNWKSKEREITTVVTLVAQKRLDSKYLQQIEAKFGIDNLALKDTSGGLVSTLEKLSSSLKNEEGTVRVDGTSYQFQSVAYDNPALGQGIRLFVFTDDSQISPNSSRIFKSIGVTAIITLVLGLMVGLYFMSNEPQYRNKNLRNPVISPAIYPDHLQLNVPPQPVKERFLLIEDKGKSQTIPLSQVSHIRVTDHYCTIFYLQENQWKSWMIMERLKTFEDRYRHLMIKINRSTLINPDRIDKIQLLQRKLTMQGEPDYLLTISKNSLDDIKSAVHQDTGINSSQIP